MDVKKFRNAIGYIGMSTGTHSEDAQREKVLSYANAQGYVIVEWFIEETSTASEDHPKFHEILYRESIANPPFEAVITFTNSQVTSDTKLYFYYLYILEKRNIKLLSVQEEFPSEDFADVCRSLTLFIAKQEKRDTALRTGNSRKVKAAAGGYSGGRAPLGYKIESGQMVIAPEEAEIVRKIFELKKQGLSMLRISEALNEAGYRSRSGGWFYTSHIKSVLDNEPTYRGLYRYGVGKDKKDVPWVPGVHEPILKDDCE